MRSVRKCWGGIQDGSGWTEVDGMLCLATKRGLLANSKAKQKRWHLSATYDPYTASNTRATPQGIHHILVKETAINYFITHSVF